VNEGFRVSARHQRGRQAPWRALAGTRTIACAIVLTLAFTVSVASADTASSDQRLRAAERRTQQAFKGAYRPMDRTPRRAVAGKRIAVISAGQASVSAQVPADAAMAAAKQIGWDAQLYDGALVPAGYPGLVRQAVAPGVDGIVLVAIDCQAVKQPLQEAKQAGIVVIGIGSFDCDDPLGGGDAKGLFTTRLNFGPRGQDLGKLVESYGEDQANYIIAASENAAKVILLTDPEFTTLRYTDRGFTKTIRQSKGSKIVSRLEITTADFTNGKLVPKIQAELVKHPEATWIRSPYTYVTTLGIVPALGTRAGSIDIMGGEGSQDELDILRAGKITAVNIFPAAWEGWAAIDTMNSSFRGSEPVDSGLGWVLADRDHNVPASGPYEPPIDFRAAFRKVWGV
jgi:ribose transport system substrate-binding protein